VRPAGSKQGLGQRILGARDVRSNVLSQLNRLLPACCLGGIRFQNQNFLTFFAGTDLLYGMRNALRIFGFDSPVVFRERILKGIEESDEEVWTWLPEWQQLRELISNFGK
jgi:hypothetical protein